MLEKINTFEWKSIQYTNTNRGKNELHAGNYLGGAPSIGKLIEEGVPPPYPERLLDEFG